MYILLTFKHGGVLMIQYLYLILFIFFNFIVGCDQNVLQRKDIDMIDPINPAPEWFGQIKNFNSCQEIEAYFLKHPHLVNLASSNENKQFTQHFVNQVEDVKEGDILQQNEDYFFFLRTGTIEIINKNNFQSSISINFEEKMLNFGELVVTKENLFLLISDEFQTYIYTYGLINKINLIDKKSFKGQIVNYRIIDNQLIVITNAFYNSNYSEAECKKIFIPNLQDGSSQISYIYQMNLNNLKFNQLGLMGGTDFIYMTNKELLLVAKNYNYDFNFQSQDETYVRRIRLNSEAPILDQILKFKGTLKDKSAIHVRGENLFLVTHKLNYNMILAYGKNDYNNYEIKSQSQIFGLEEDIKSSYFYENILYVVTYKNIDPLFIFDLSDPYNIILKASLDSPGFSTQLKKINNDNIVGLGYNTKLNNENFEILDGIKISIFDFKSISNPFEVYTKVWGQRGSTSEATANFKALTVSKDTGRIMFPLVELDFEHSNFSNKLKFSGAIILQFDNSHGAQEIKRISHQEWVSKYCGKDFYQTLFWWGSEHKSFDIQRIIEIDNTIYTFSRFGVKKNKLDFDNPNETSLEFKVNGFDRCEFSNNLRI